MKIKTPEERKALRNGYSAGFRRANLDENPYKLGSILRTIWDFGFYNIPDISMINDVTVIKWACFKCGETYKEQSNNRRYIFLIYDNLMFGSNFCPKCGDGTHHHLREEVKGISYGWSF